ncbi:phage tail protein [Salmonella enterica]|nr:MULTISPECIES: phage tail protein [unclassified Salmonella]EBI9458319.1 phage tail protein [Salmonella enterica]EBZ0339951.1 phage tail protein [Salmonella enterica subsp. enterica serovar Infantis]HBD1681452.1 phage tail protein [Escherichia coli]EBL9507785.1 phage tail protein [Salmonella enterica]ECB4668221.1 phage tail protein [Salmonella enterica subsp. enterica serovar Infantis]
MTVKYYAILTNQGAARLANATMLGSKLNLTQMAVGDANGVLPTPDPAQTKLINQKRIAPLNLLSVDPNNQSQIIAEQIIPENEGGFWIREIGLYDDEGVLIAVANCPETYKPQLQEGSGRTQTIRMILVVTNTEAITLKIDPSVVLATRKYVDDEVLELRLYVDDQMSKHIAAQDPHTQYAQKHNPTFTGEPKAPTPAAGNNTTRIATTEFVQAAITALINGAPATLDTLKEIAAAINNDPKFSTTINNALAGKQPLDNTLTHLSGKDVAGLLAYLGLGEGSALPVGVPVPWPSATPPTGWLKCNGAAFSAEEYPELAKAYPTNKLPDLRGEFIRGWDDGRGMDTGRAILSAQGDAIRNIYGEFKTVNTENYSIWESVGSFKGAVVPLNPSTNNSYFSLIRSMVTERTDGAVYPKVIGLDASRIVPTANENRPRNIAFNYIVRAA